jgi:hypothetical protein
MATRAFLIFTFEALYIGIFSAGWFRFVIAFSAKAFY